MPRCSCDGGKCSCLILPGAGIEVDGSGSASNPYIISATQDLTSRIAVVDTPSVDMHAVGSGTPDDPLIISADVTMSMDDLEDVTAPAPDAGDTLVWDGTAWVTRPPAVVPPGTVNVGPGLIGTGSIDNPIAAAVSGVWGTPPLDVYGDDSTVGGAIYIDSNGQLRAEPVETEVSWDDITGKPTSFPTTWDEVTGKPSSWPTSSSTAFFGAYPGNGWTTISQYAYRTGSVCTVALMLRRTGSPISTTVDGNFVNESVGGIGPTLRPLYAGPMTTTSTGPVITGYVDSTGVVRLSASVPNFTITTGMGLSIAGTWVCAGG